MSAQFEKTLKDTIGELESGHPYFVSSNKFFTLHQLKNYNESITNKVVLFFDTTLYNNNDLHLLEEHFINVKRNRPLDYYQYTLVFLSDSKFCTFLSDLDFDTALDTIKQGDMTVGEVATESELEADLSRYCEINLYQDEIDLNMEFQADMELTDTFSRKFTNSYSGKDTIARELDRVKKEKAARAGLLKEEADHLFQWVHRKAIRENNAKLELKRLATLAEQELSTVYRLPLSQDDPSWDALRSNGSEVKYMNISDNARLAHYNLKVQPPKYNAETHQTVDDIVIIVAHDTLEVTSLYPTQKQVAKLLKHVSPEATVTIAIATMGDGYYTNIEAVTELEVSQATEYFSIGTPVPSRFKDIDIRDFLHGNLEKANRVHYIAMDESFDLKKYKEGQATGLIKVPEPFMLKQQFRVYQGLRVCPLKSIDAALAQKEKLALAEQVREQEEEEKVSPELELVDQSGIPQSLTEIKFNRINTTQYGNNYFVNPKQKAANEENKNRRIKKGVISVYLEEKVISRYRKLFDKLRLIEKHKKDFGKSKNEIQKSSYGICNQSKGYKEYIRYSDNEKLKTKTVETKNEKGFSLFEKSKSLKRKWFLNLRVISTSFGFISPNLLGIP